MADDNPAPAVLNEQVHCPNVKCGKPFEGYRMAQVQGVKRLVTASTIVYHTKMVCIHCGALFHWHEDDRSLEKDAVVFIELLGQLHGQKEVS